MDALPLWLTVGAIIAACVTSVLHVTASILRDDQAQYELAEKVKAMRADYQRRLRAMAEASGGLLTFDGTPQVTGEFDIVPDEQPAPQRKAA
jgi:hypothetical protein